MGQQTDKDGKVRDELGAERSLEGTTLISSFPPPPARLLRQIIPLGAIMKSVEVKTGCSLEASTQMKTGVTHFVVKGANQRAVDQAIKLIKARLSKIVRLLLWATRGRDGVGNDEGPSFILFPPSLPRVAMAFSREGC